MAWQSLTIGLTHKEDAEAFEDFLLELGALSITYSDAGDDPILEPALNTTPLWKETFVTALFEHDVDLFVIGAALVNKFGHEKFIINDAREVADKPWEREWLKHFEPMKFGDSLWVCPSNMDIPSEEKSEHDVVITLDPGLAFGTGTHETTALCLEQLDNYDVSGLKVLDFGCGSGILAIAAHKLGARSVTGVDIDPQAITATLDNAERNNIDANFYVYVTDEDEEDEESWNQEAGYDVIVANILSKPLIDLAQKIIHLLKPNGYLILSGIMRDQAESVRAAYAEAIALEPTEFKGDWVAVVGTKKPSPQTLEKPKTTQIPEKRIFVPKETRAESLIKLNEQVDETKEVLAIKHCPHCHHVQNFDLYDLEYADGKARCDQCHKIYNAYSAVDVKIEADTILIDGEVADNRDIPHLSSADIRNFKPKISRSATLQAPQALDAESIEASIKSDLAQTLASRPELDVYPEDDTIILEFNPVLAELADSIDIDAPIDDADSKGIETKSEKSNFSEGNYSDADSELNTESLSENHTTQEVPLLELEDVRKESTTRRPFNFVWASLSVLSLAFLIVQFIHHNRSELALHPKFGSDITQAYKRLGLELQPNWKLSQYKSISTGVSLNPNGADELIVSAVIQNTAKFAQPYPIVRLSLQNRWGEPIAYKDFRPSDYLATGQVDTLLAAEQTHNIRITVEDPGNEALDYHSDLCLEFGSVERTLQCQNGR